MGKKKALRRLVVQEILTSKARFISITLLILIGVSFFAGLNASGPDMLKTAALFFDNQNLMDMHVVSTMGLEEKDIDILKQQADIDQIEVGYSQDVITKKEEKLLKIYSYSSSSQLNQFELKRGRLPVNSQEIALSAIDTMEKLYQIGDIVTFIPDSKDTDLAEQFNDTSYTVVGFVTSPLYVNKKQMGSSTIGKGSVDGYGVIGTDEFTISVYTDAYITFQSLKGVNPYSEQYKSTIEQYQEDIKYSFAERATVRLNDIKTDAQNELDDAKEQLADGKTELSDGHKKLIDAKEKIDDANVQIVDAQNQLADAKKQLEDGQTEYDTNKASFDEQIADGKVQLDIGGNQLADGQNTLDQNREKVEQGQKQITDGLKQLETQEVALTQQKGHLEEFSNQAAQIVGVPISYVTSEQQSALIQAGSSISLGDNQTLGDLWSSYFAGEASGDSIIQALSGVLAQVEAGVNTIADTKEDLLAKQEELNKAQAQIDSGQEALNAGADLIIGKNQEYEVAKADGDRQLADAKTKLEDGWADYNSGVAELEEQKQKLVDAEKEYADGLAEYNEKEPDAQKEIADAEEKIADGEKELADLEQPTYYALSREDNAGYTEYADNAKRLSSLSLVFPSFFFAIAALVSLTTITRMIEEQRVQIGTLKAQGYTNGEISLKYYVYALSAGILGGLLGLVLGFYGIPRIIINAYSSMYDFPNRQLVFYIPLELISLGIAVFCTGISAWAVLRQELKSTPAQLMRPKAPKSGKRILLERITPLWNRLNFNQKVTMRNLFRYKQRMIMTIFGIAGCMGLMMTGFGLNDSISDLSQVQYQTILRYQALVVLDEDANEDDTTKAKEAIADLNGIDDYLMVQTDQYDVKKAGVNTQQVYVFVPREIERFSQFVLLRNRGSDSSYEIPEEGAIITEKLADLFGVKVGDSITISDSDNQEFSIPVAHITENYTGHYIYMSPQTYKKYFNSPATYNATLLCYQQDKAWEEEVSNSLKEYSAIQAISFNSDTIEMFDDSMGSLISVVVVLIISAAVLAFVVLYNLTNINVSERIRELSTIKVLGFYDKEVTMYIYRENVILSLFGILFGSMLGKFLHYFVLDTASMDNMMFSDYLHLHSYIYAGVLTLLFSFMVMWVMHIKLKHVDMIEALKSNE
ncbi:MAG: FtsX-like permease family protein [Lachnotalea sp.]